MKELKTSIIITASPKRVWRVLMDFVDYPRWNPFIKWIQGIPEPGRKIKVWLQPPSGMGMTFKPRVLVNRSPYEFRWRGRVLISGLFDGEHRFEIQDNQDGTVTFVQAEKFTGVLVPLLLLLLERSTKDGFETMNLKLKEVCERVNKPMHPK